MFTCGDCHRTFPAGWRSRQQHFDATGHGAPDFECDECDKYFRSRQAVEQHMSATNHWSQESSSEESEEEVFDCTYCSFRSWREDDLRDHEVEGHLYCKPCDRGFQTLNGINQHLHSRIHRTTSVTCPFCNTTCGTATGLVHHLERGACPRAPLDREKLYAAVRSRDPDGIISKHLLCAPDSTIYEATERSWNASTQRYHCYLCGRGFNQLAHLNQHLSSPAHQQNLYHCPNRARCGKEFTTLAAVMNHMESESCGFMRFDSVQTSVQRLLDPRRMIQF